MQMFDTQDLSGPDDWSGPTLTGFGNAAVKLRWINMPFDWHSNNGAEVFLVLDREVDMHIRNARDAAPAVVHRNAGQLVLVENGEEHGAHPCGAARVLVVERADHQA